MKLFTSLSDDLAAWIQRQPVFFTGSASTHGAHINVSPKGLADSHFAVLSPNQVAYIDRTGSGCETIAHSYENGRLCIMFMSFGPTPRILRLFCRSQVIECDHPEFDAYVEKVAAGRREGFEGARAVIIANVWQVQTSCGYGVPRVKKALYENGSDSDGDDKDARETQTVPDFYQGVLRQGTSSQDQLLDERCVFETRPTLDSHAAKSAGEKAFKYRSLVNSRSLDGLPGLKTARRHRKEVLWLGDLRARLSRLTSEKVAVVVGFLLATLFYSLVHCGGLLTNINRGQLE